MCKFYNFVKLISWGSMFFDIYFTSYYLYFWHIYLREWFGVYPNIHLRSLADNYFENCMWGRRRKIEESDMISFCMENMLYVKCQNDRDTGFFFFFYLFILYWSMDTGSLNEGLLLTQGSPPLRAASVLNVSRKFSLEEGWIAMPSFNL